MIFTKVYIVLLSDYYEETTVPIGVFFKEEQAINRMKEEEGRISKIKTNSPHGLRCYIEESKIDMGVL